MKNRRRWADDDRYWGPFTYSKKGCGTGIMLVSSGEEVWGCRLRLHAFNRTLIVALPPILLPKKRKVIAHSWDEETVCRLGRNWYWEVTHRELGFNVQGLYLFLNYGAQTMDSRTERSKTFQFPWKALRHVRTSVYGLEGEWIADEGARSWNEWNELVQKSPSVSFKFRDFDREIIEATTRITEREWHHGAGLFKWLSWFKRPQISRSLEIQFSKETGPRKGSWKGGTIAHGIEMLPGELHESAFRRYCVQHGMRLIQHSAVSNKKFESGRESTV